MRSGSGREKMYVGQVRRMHEGFCSITAWFKTKARTYVGFSVEIT